MYWPSIAHILRRYFIALAVILSLPGCVALYGMYTCEETWRHSGSFFIVSGGCALLALLMRCKNPYPLFRKESIFVSVAIWVLTPLIGAIPYTISGTVDSYIDALFESTSGFTTTGASNLLAKRYERGREIPYAYTCSIDPPIKYEYQGNLTPRRGSDGLMREGIESLPKSLLFWRSLSQWLGGMGILLLFVALTPIAGLGSRVLYQSEVTGPTKETLTPRVAETASILWKIYIAMTLLATLAIKLSSPKIVGVSGAIESMPWFDAITLSFSTISTGGFSIRNASIAAYASPALEWILIFFMTLGGTSFSLLYLLGLYMMGRSRWKLGRCTELRLYLLTLLIGSGVLALYLIGNPIHWLDGATGTLNYEGGVRTALFHYISSQTSTGFATANYDIWPYLPQVLILTSMYLGGMSGSTAGGTKILRLWILVRYSFYTFKKVLSPQEVAHFKVEEQLLSERTVPFIFVFFFSVVAISAISIVYFVASGIEPESALTLTASLINNIGFSFRLAGPTQSFAFLPPHAKVYSCFLMLLGRLEFFTLLLFFLPSFWKRA